MINEPIPEGLGEPQPPEWNSKVDEVMPGLTCNDAAKFMGAYIGSFRLLEGIKKQSGLKGQIEMINNLVQIQCKSVYDYGLGKEEPERTDKLVQLGVMAVMLAAHASCIGLDIQGGLQLANHAMNAALQVAEKNPDKVKESALSYAVRKSAQGDGLDITVDLIDVAVAKAAMKKSEIGSIIASMKVEEQLKHGPGNN